MVNKERRHFLLGVPPLFLGLLGQHFTDLPQLFDNLLKGSNTAIDLDIPQRYKYLAVETGLVSSFRGSLLPDHTLHSRITQTNPISDISGRTQILSSLDLRKKVRDFQLLTGAPFGSSLDYRVEHLEEFQEQVDRVLRGQSFRALHLGSFNGSYGRFYSKGNGGDKTLIGSRGLRYKWFEGSDLEPSSKSLKQLSTIRSSWIAEAHPHFYNHKLIDQVSADGYYIDSYTHSAESIFLQIPNDVLKQLGQDQMSRLREKALKVASSFSRQMSETEKTYLKKIAEKFRIDEFPISTTFAKNYSQWLLSRPTQNQDIRLALIKNITNTTTLG